MINREVTTGVTPRGNPAAGPAYRSTCSAAPRGSFHFLIYGLASNSRSRTFQVNKLFPLGCLPLFAHSCHYRCPPPTQPSVCQAAVQTTRLCSHDRNHLKSLQVKENKKKKNTGKVPYNVIFLSLFCSESSPA